MADATPKTANIDGRSFDVRPAANDEPDFGNGFVTDDTLIIEGEPEKHVRTCDIQDLPQLIDADGTAVGYMCPGCGRPVPFTDALWYQDGFRGCTDDECTVVVDCSEALPVQVDAGQRELVDVLREIRRAHGGDDVSLYLWDQQFLVPFEDIEADPTSVIEWSDVAAWDWRPDSSVELGITSDTDEARYFRIGVVMNPQVCYPIIGELPTGDDPAALRFTKWASISVDNGQVFVHMDV